jgi:transcriptional regulator with GAF, ATPase, and Fis domain
VAQAIHQNSPRKNKPFVALNCAALSENILESELFGHVKGAFTDASTDRVGKFEYAHGGTMFLDEVGDMSQNTQAKILRVLQEHEFERLGGTRTLKVDVRVIAATNRNLPAMVTAGQFREDLFYRLNVVSVEIPPLRDRKDDIAALTATFVRKFTGEFKRKIEGIAPDAQKMLARYNWPGNIRELENAIERAVLLTEGPVITVEDLRLGETIAVGGDPGSTPVVRIPPTGVALEDIERQAVTEALRMCNWIQRDAGDLLHVSARVINYKMKTLGIESPASRRPAPAPKA